VQSTRRGSPTENELILDRLDLCVFTGFSAKEAVSDEGYSGNCYVALRAPKLVSQDETSPFDSEL